MMKRIRREHLAAALLTLFWSACSGEISGPSPAMDSVISDLGLVVPGDGFNSSERVGEGGVPTDSLVLPDGKPCGNGALDKGEQCDDGLKNSNTTPNACRKDCTLPRCGDSVVDTKYHEACDDGNTKSGDGCSSDCSEKRVIKGLKIYGTNYDIGTDKQDGVHLLWKSSSTLYYSTLNGWTIAGQEVVNLQKQLIWTRLIHS